MNILDFEGESIDIIISVLGKSDFEVVLNKNVFKLFDAEGKVHLDFTVLMLLLTGLF